MATAASHLPPTPPQAAAAACSKLSSSKHKRKAFVDLTQFVDSTSLAKLDAYLLSHDVMHYDEYEIFPANGKKHADAIQLCNRGTSTWCMDAFYSRSTDDDFKQCRAHRGDPKTWRQNHNGRRLPGVLTFAYNLQRVFEQVGRVVVICNAPMSKGAEHCDHKFDDLVSEFIWVRTTSSNKRFYVRDPTSGEAQFVGHTALESNPMKTTETQMIDEKIKSRTQKNDDEIISATDGTGNACVCWFDDHLMHSIEQSTKENQWSIRIDGRFTPEIREFVCRNGVFGDQRGSSTPGGLRGVLSAQTAGPSFLIEPPYSDDEVDLDDT